MILAKMDVFENADVMATAGKHGWQQSRSQSPRAFWSVETIHPWHRPKGSPAQ